MKLRLVHELNITMDAVESMTISEFMEWTAYFYLRDEAENEKLRVLSGARRKNVFGV